MPKRIVLVSANTCTDPDPVFPLGMAYLDAALRDAGHETRWHDALASNGSLEDLITDFKPHCVGLSLRNVDDVLIHRQETYFSGLAGLCDRIRTCRPCPIVLGGSGFSIFPEELLLGSGADYGIHGSGERALLVLLEALDGRLEPTTVPGLVWRDGAVVRTNPQDIVAAPVPLRPADWPNTIVSYYLAAAGTLNLQTQRGCAHRCCYCTYPVVEGRRHRGRPPEELAEEMVALRRSGARYVFLVDSIFNSSPDHVAAVCEALIRSDAPLPWACFIRPRGLTAELCALARRAGLTHAEIGSDSFCDRVLEAYRKHFSFDDILRTTHLLREQAVECCHFVISGGPGETEATLEDGFANSLRLGETVILATVGMRIYPGTELHRRAIAEGQLAADAGLLQPTYYLAPGLGADWIRARLSDFAGRAAAWLVGDIPPAYRELVARLRARGRAGPLWSYVSAMRRVYGDASLRPPVPEPEERPGGRLDRVEQ